MEQLRLEVRVVSNNALKLGLELAFGKSRYFIGQAPTIRVFVQQKASIASNRAIWDHESGIELAFARSRPIIALVVGSSGH